MGTFSIRVFQSVLVTENRSPCSPRSAIFESVDTLDEWFARNVRKLLSTGDEIRQSSQDLLLNVGALTSSRRALALTVTVYSEFDVADSPHHQPQTKVKGQCHNDILKVSK